jgi:hypothetical protein
MERGASNSERTRHIGTRFFFVKDHINTKEIELHYLPTEQMIADVLTEPLQGALFRKMRALLMNLEM